MQGARVLVVDGDRAFRASVRAALEQEGAEVFEASGNDEGLDLLGAARPDLVCLDVPEADALALDTLDSFRERTGAALLLISEHADAGGRARALRHGADDCIEKPRDVEELAARGEALLRRTAGAPAGRYADALVTIDCGAARAHAGGRPLDLTPLEFRLLWVLTTHAGRVLSAEDLLRLAWREPDATRQRVKIYVGYLRAKLRAAGVEPPIDTVRGFGYRYTPSSGQRP